MPTESHRDTELVIDPNQSLHEIGMVPYRLADFRNLLAYRPTLRLSDECTQLVDRGAGFVAERARLSELTYGVNTGFGSLCETRVPPDELSLLQRNHLLSHACGVGPPIDADLSRLVLFIKLLTLRSGHTGISRGPIDRLLAMWNSDVIPVIPKKGTVGASGDLAPLAHMALPLIGEGTVYVDGEMVESNLVLDRFGWEPLVLQPKEGLALTNGIQYLDAMAVGCLLDIADLVACADLVTSLSIQGFSCASTFYQDPLHLVTLHEDRLRVARNLQLLLEGSNHHELPTCNGANEDPYSFRCVPQVHGAIRQVVGFATTTVENDCNSVSDNPLFFPESGQVLCGGNLHGESAAFCLDFLAIAMSELANISERRTYCLLSGTRGLPDFLAPNPGVNSGMMITQYTAAALVNENKILASPASTDTIPTCQLQEDHVSMGGTSGYKLQQIITNCWTVLAIELLAACQAIELLPDLQPSPVAVDIIAELRAGVPTLVEDRIQSRDIEAAQTVLRVSAGRWRNKHALM